MNDDHNTNQGRGPSPLTNSITDFVMCVIGAGLLFWVIGLATGAWQ